jgi:hypothetical protein
MRAGEALQLMRGELKAAGDALGRAGDVLQRWAAQMQGAAAAMEAAQKARDEAVRHQVGSQFPGRNCCGGGPICLS